MSGLPLALLALTVGAGTWVVCLLLERRTPPLRVHVIEIVWLDPDEDGATEWRTLVAAVEGDDPAARDFAAWTQEMRDES